MCGSGEHTDDGSHDVSVVVCYLSLSLKSLDRYTVALAWSTEGPELGERKKKKKLVAQRA